MEATWIWTRWHIGAQMAEMVETVRLEGYRLTFAAAGSGLATIFPEEGSHVDGVLWSLTGDCEKSLDLYEGYPEFLRQTGNHRQE